ncbi:MAG: hypothetical protein EHM48_09320, partial [Planctomycetaceae bacterium]
MNEILFTPYQNRNKKILQKLFWTAAKSCALGGLYAWTFHEHLLKIDRRDMPLVGLGEGFDGATVAHISDLHCSPIVLEKYLRQCVDAINALDVDFVAMTGDFITGPKVYARRIARILRELRPRVATVACLGNHDYGIFHPRGIGGMRGLAEYLTDELTNADVLVILNECRTFTRNGAKVQFVGLEDFWSSRYNPYQAFEMVRRDVPAVALCHNPDAAMQVSHFGAQWVLAGHTHGSGMPKTRISDMVLPTSHRHFIGGQYSLGTDR